MNADDFDRLAARTRLQARALRMARAVLVDGVGPSEAGRREGCSHEAARAAAARVVRELRIEGGYPPGWRAVTVMVPPDVAAEIEVMASMARRKAG
jgi:hypothetical protein